MTVGACSSDHPDEAGTTTTTDAPTTTTIEPTTTSTAPTTTTTDAPACPANPRPEAAEEVTEVTADVDGDGRPDTLSTLRTAGGWQLRVDLGAGGDATVPVESFGGSVGVIGGSDVDGDGTDEIWSRVGSGASAVIVALADFGECAVTWVSTPSGERAEMPVGGSVGTTSGVECGTTVDPEGDLTTYSAMLVGEGPDYEIAATEHRLDGAILTPGTADGAVVSAEDPEFARFTSFHCGDLSL